MRSLTIYLLSIIFFITDSRGQCHINDFSTACGSTMIVGFCTTFVPDCGGWWYRSHGTPEMKFNDDPSPYKPDDFWYGYMWAAQNQGEGIYTYVPPFQPNTTYDVQLRISTDNWNGSLVVYAANSVPTVGSACGGAVPNVPQKQFVGQYNGPTSGWQLITLTFTPNAAYNQLWIYPTASGAQYNVGVRWMQICKSCVGSIVYNNGVVPTGVTRSGAISMGSTAGTGGSGTVTVNPTASTSIISTLYNAATSYIELLPNFEASVTTGTLSLEAYMCWEAPGRVGSGNKDFENSYAPLHITNELDVLPVTKAGPLQVYPTVTSGRINISGDYKDLENGDLTVYDLSGRQVLRQSNAIKSKLTTIDLGQLNNGIYLVEIRNARKQFTQKIIISH